MSLMNPQPPLEGADLSSFDALEEDTPKETMWLSIARQVYEGSSDWLDTNLRYQWERSLSLFKLFLSEYKSHTFCCVD